MANERRLNKSAARTPRHGTTTTNKTTATTNRSNGSNGSSSSNSSSNSSSTVNGTSSGKKQSSRQYRIPHPPVPHAQTSLLQSQRVPASAVSYSSSARQGVGQEPRQLYETRYQPAVGRGLASTTTTAVTTTRTPTPTTRRAAVDVANTTSEAAANASSADSPVPAADPDSMEAKKGLNKWGAFDSFSGSGTGTFGFGPLLFHHVDETPRDPYDTTNMMLNDPISFNPMSAISWARLDDSPESVDELLGDHAASTQQRQRGTAAGNGGSRHDASSSSYVGYVDSPASTPASPRPGGGGGDGGSYGSDASESRTSSVAGSSVGNISRTFSDTSLVGRDTERSTASAQPAYPSPSSSRAAHTPQTQRQHEQQQVYSSQPPPPSNQNPAAYRAIASQQPYPSRSYTHPRPQEHRHHHQQQPSSRSYPPPQQRQQQQRAPMPQTTLPPHQAPPLPPPPPPIAAPPAAATTTATTTTTDLLLCLGPHCSARFPTEAELAAHYRAEHAFTCTWTSCAAPSFTSSNALAWHVNAEHLLVCPVPGCCGAAYASKRALEGHLKVRRFDFMLCFFFSHPV